MRRDGNVAVIVILIIAIAFSLFLIVPIGGWVGLLREQTISFLFRKPPRFTSLEVSVNNTPHTIQAGESLKIKGDEILVIDRIHANTFFNRYLTADIAGFGKPNDLHEPIQTAEIRKQIMSAGIRSIPIDVYYIDHPIAKVPLVIDVAEDDFLKRLAKARDMGEKIAILHSAHLTFPENSYFLDNLEALLLQKGDYEALAGIYKAMVEKNPANTKAQERLSRAYIKLGRFDEALAINKQIEEQGKATAETYRDIGSIAGEQGKLEDRIANLEKAHALDMHNEDIILDLGKAYEDTGKQAQAMDLYREVAPWARKKEILVPVIQDALQRKDFKGAEPLLKHYVELYPGDKNAVAQLGQLMGNIGDPQGQIAYYQKAARLSPNDPVLLYNLAVSYNKAGHDREALNTFLTLLKKRPDDTDALAAAAALALKLGQPAEAYRFYATLAQKKSSPDHLRGLVSAAVALRDEDKIINASKQFLAKSKEYDVAMQLGYAYEAKANTRKGRERAKILNDALDAYRLALQLKPASEKAGQKISDIKIEILKLKQTP